MADDARALIEQAVTRFLDEVPALKPMKLVVGVSLRGRGDNQIFRLQLPEVQVATEAHVADWREAFMYGQAKATGPTQILQLIERVVEKQEERSRQRRAKHR